MLRGGEDTMPRLRAAVKEFKVASQERCHHASRGHAEPEAFQA